MGLSRNKVAVSEGAAGSPPFYGESNLAEINCRAEIEKETNNEEEEVIGADEESANHLLFDFQGLIEKRNRETTPWGTMGV